MLLQLHFSILKCDAFCFQQLDLPVFPSERECLRNLTEPVDNTVARNSLRIRIYMERISDNARPSFIPCKLCDLPVCRHLAERYLSYDIVYRAKGVLFLHIVFSSLL